MSRDARNLFLNEAMLVCAIRTHGQPERVFRRKGYRRKPHAGSHSPGNIQWHLPNPADEGWG